MAEGGKAVPTAARVALVRAEMERQGLDAFLIPSGDPHQSEIPPEHYSRRAFISGFAGSWGVALITRTQALLWTDGRYHLQANQQLEQPTWELMRHGLPDVPDLDTWIADNMSKGSVVGFDPWLMTIAAHRKMHQALLRNSRKPVELRPVEVNPVDVAWAAETGANRRPALSAAPAFVQPVEFAGLSVKEKLEKVAEDLRKSKADRLVVTALDDVAWLLNLRGSDIDYHPVFISYCIASADATATLFIDPKKLPQEVRQHLFDAGVTIAEYSEITSVIASPVPADGSPHQSAGEDKWVAYAVDPQQANYKLFQTAVGNPQASVVELDSPVTALKAVKNAVEIEGMRRCHVRDAVALVSYLAWLEAELEAGGTITEISGAKRLAEFRAEQKDFMGLSFESISSVGPNGAVIHYRPEEGTNKRITRDELYLIDSGGHYRDGTTDVTRTVHFGQPTEYEKETFTRVLKGVISLSTAVFPPTVTGHQLDSWARRSLWEVGLNYLHGTGHGVGSFLNVHEGPHGIGLAPVAAKLKAGCITSIEPGFYEDGKFGIRIENLAVVQEAVTAYKFKGQTYLGFEQLTVVPIAHNLIDKQILTTREVEWINAYHATVFATLSPLLNGNTLVYLKRACEPL